MKKLFSLCMVFVVPAMMIACAKKNDDTTVASTPLNTTCLTGQQINQATCNNQLWTQYQQWGFSPYGGNPYILQGGYNTGMNGYMYGGYTYGQQAYTQSLCGCGYGQQVVYHNSIGLGCMSTGYGSNFGMYTGITAYWSLSATNNSWVNIPQVSNSQSNMYGTSCNGAVAQACSIGQAGSCAAGTNCVPTVTGSPIGICVRQ